jgi:hypothetical protein
MKNKNELFNKIYNIAFIIVTFILASLFILFSLTIYTKGIEELKTNPTYQIYTREIVEHYLSYIIVPFILWVLVIIFGLVTSYLFPINKKKNTKLDSILTYERLRKRVEVNNDDTNLLRRNRKIGFIIASIISLLCMILPCRYIFTPSNFTGVDSNKDVLGLVFNILPFVIISFISFIGYSIYFYKNINLEIKILLEKQKENKKDPKDNKESFFDSPLFINIVRGVILVTGITFVVLGIFNKGFEDVLIKAINICSECIGLA